MAQINPIHGLLGGRKRVGRAHPRNNTTVASMRCGRAEAAPYCSPRTGVNLRRALCAGTWNTLSLTQTEQLTLLSLDLKKIRIAIVALSKVLMPGSGENSEFDYT